MSEGLDRSYAENVVDEDCFAFLREHLRADSAFVDVGANQGIYTCITLHEFSDVSVVAVEPDPYSIDKLRRNVELNGLDASRLYLFEGAAGVDDGDVELMLNVAGNRAGSSLVVDQRRWTGQTENVTLTVSARPLKTILDDAGVARVSVLKMDIEGYEYPVLQTFFSAAAPSLWPEALIVEAFGHVIPLVGGSTIELLIQQGYHLTAHDNTNYFFVRS